jgi:hypothetical protein
MSKIFTKGNNIVNQLGCSRKVYENFWKQVQLPAEAGKVLKIDSNPGQTAVLTDKGNLILLVFRRCLGLGVGPQLSVYDKSDEWV